MLRRRRITLPHQGKSRNVDHVAVRSTLEDVPPAPQKRGQHRRVLAGLGAIGLAALCQCSLFFGLDGLENTIEGGDPGSLDATQDGVADGEGGGGSPDAGDEADDGEGGVGPFDAAEGGAPDAAEQPDALGGDGGGEAGNVDGADAAGDASMGLDASDGGGADAGSDATDSGVVLSGPLAVYLFDETSGTSAADSSGNQHTATMQGGATFAAGLKGNAATLSGTNQFVSLPAGIVANLTSFSISTWVNLSVAPRWSRIFDFGTGTNVYMFLSPNGGTGALRFAITTGGNGAEQQLNAPLLATGSWQHLAVTLTGNSGTLYLNGVAIAQNAAMPLNPSSLGTTTQNWLGRSEFTGDPFLTGQIDNFRIYDRALSAAEVQALFQQQQ
jgi:concanavalin A-like lectin/glucanase superfamily protein